MQVAMGGGMQSMSDRGGGGRMHMGGEGRGSGGMGGMATMGMVGGGGGGMDGPAHFISGRGGLLVSQNAMSTNNVTTNCMDNIDNMLLSFPDVETYDSNCSPPVRDYFFLFVVFMFFSPTNNNMLLALPDVETETASSTFFFLFSRPMLLENTLLTRYYFRIHC